ncbi:recombinase family protein [Spongiactinospora sp. 9N601]|uniref:recombinase family protein n=1 Tax=Spongiactinospora sp. 9N601 TaxID=3375149 RepID=UPI0037BA366F
MGKRSRVAIYARISQDRTGAGLGIARQEEDCRALAERLGWNVIDVYPDNDVSAYSGKPRPQWERLLADVRADEIDGIVCWHVDRLTRSPRELEDVIDLHDRHDVALATVTGEIDLSTPSGRMVARMLGAAARQEAEHKAERQQRARVQAAERGRRNGGGTRPFGYTLIYDHDTPPRRVLREEINEPEAEVVREAARRALSGEKLSAIVRDFADREITSTNGKPFTQTTLRAVLASARISGRREYSPRKSGETKRALMGEIVCDTAEWPAIIDAQTSDRLRAFFSIPHGTNGASTGRRYLLSGILKCGWCGHGLVGRIRHDKGSQKGKTRYICAPSPDGRGGCGKITAAMDPVDKHVREAAGVRLESADFVDRLYRRDVDADAVTQALRAVEERLEYIAADYGAGVLTRAEWKAAKGVADAKREELRRMLARSENGAILVVLEQLEGDFEDKWAQLTIGQRRALLSAVIDHIKVKPNTPGKRTDPKRFEIVWKA